MGDRRTADEVRAAGAVVWRPAGNGAQVALVHRPKYDDWSFPKGKLEPGEHALLAAVREVAEETALRVTLGCRLPAVEYCNGDVPKRVDYWAATVSAALSDFEPTSEVDEVEWVAASRADDRLSYERDVATLDSFRAGQRATVPLILLRHASAGDKSGWPGSDLSRPLDSRGEAEAQTLASLLRCFGAGRVVSAPAERCVATVRPFAASIGGVVEIEAAFEVDATDPAGAGGAGGLGGVGGLGGAGGLSSTGADGTVGAIGALGAAAAGAIARLATGSRPVVVCAHRENLPALVAAACAAVGAECPAQKPLRKSEFAVLHRAGGTLAALERYHPDGASLVIRQLAASVGLHVEPGAETESEPQPKLSVLAGARLPFHLPNTAQPLRR